MRHLLQFCHLLYMFLHHYKLHRNIPFRSILLFVTATALYPSNFAMLLSSLSFFIYFFLIPVFNNNITTNKHNKPTNNVIIYTPFFLMNLPFHIVNLFIISSISYRNIFTSSNCFVRLSFMVFLFCPRKPVSFVISNSI